MKKIIAALFLILIVVYVIMRSEKDSIKEECYDSIEEVFSLWSESIDKRTYGLAVLLKDYIKGNNDISIVFLTNNLGLPDRDYTAGRRIEYLFYLEEPRDRDPFLLYRLIIYMSNEFAYDAMILD